MMKRREFITLLGSAAAAWPIAARAQQPAVPVIGYLGGQSRNALRARLDAFLQGLRETGYIEGQNLTIEYRYADGQYDRLPTLAGDLVHRQVALIASGGATEAALAAKAATTTIPIVFSTAVDPVESGLVASLNRPGGNLTGATNLNIAVIAKRLEMLHQIVPGAALIAVLVNASNRVTTEAETKELQTAARILGVSLLILSAGTSREIETAFANLDRERAGALLVSGDSFFTASRDQLIALVARYAVPAIYQVREFATAGGLASYGADIVAVHRVMGVYAGRILNGEKPYDLPVQRVTKLELVINLKTAKALGLAIPPALLANADEVIE
jgi:putative ABC transport system substrate-binding protein